MDRRVAIVLVISLVLLGLGFLVQGARGMGLLDDIGVQHPEAPVGVAGYLYRSDGSPMPSGVAVVVYNSGNGAYSNATSQGGVYATGISGRTGDVVFVYVEYDGGYGCSRVEVDASRVTQWCNVTIGMDLCGATGGRDWSPLLFLLSAMGCFTFAGVVSHQEKLFKYGGKK